MEQLTEVYCSETEVRQKKEVHCHRGKEVKLK